MDEEIVVLGFDGMDHEILKEAMERRKLENFEKMGEQGFIQSLESSEPPTTIPAWPSMFTGKNPGKLGLFHFQKLNQDSEEFEPVDLESVYGEYVWDHGIETSLVFLPGITPPYEIEGKIIEGPPGPAKPRTYPDGLRESLEDRFDFDAFETNSSGLNQVLSYFEERKKIAKHMLEEKSQELNVTVFRPTDTVAHYRENKKSFYDIYEKMDSLLGYYMNKADKQGFNLIVVSDHGARKFDEAFFVNKWLENQGYLTRKTSSSTKQENILKLSSILVDIGLRPVLEKIHGLYEKATGSSLKPNSRISGNVDWDETQAVSCLIGALPTTGIAVNESNIDDAEQKESLISSIKEDLEDTDQVDWVKRRENVYKGSRTSELPELILGSDSGVMMKSKFHETETMRFEKYGHDYPGIICGYGEDINPDFSGNANIKDVAPTIASFINSKIPASCDGKTLKNMFDRTMPTAEHNYSNQELGSGEERNEKIKDRLEDLGYNRG
jgi:predicted AlkP superfamily phosphohydrolase/phosphomutase